jgi:hypothetical protein
MSQAISTTQPAPALLQTNKQIREELLRQQSITERQCLMERSSAGLRPIADPLAGRKRQRSTVAPGDLTTRQLRRSGGACGQAALLFERDAQYDVDPESAAEKRALALKARGLARHPQNLEFDFVRGGNFSFGDQFLDAIFARISDAARTPVQRSHAMTHLLAIGRWVGWHKHECLKSVSELARYRRVGRGQAEHIGNPTIADAVLDRLVHTAHRVECQGRVTAQAARRESR